MINLEKNINSDKKYNYFFFDFDGVVFDSKKNMENSWNQVMKKYSINKNFNE